MSLLEYKVNGDINTSGALEAGIVDELVVGERRNYIYLMKNDTVWASLEEVPFQEGKELIEKAKSLGIKVTANAYGMLFTL